MIVNINISLFFLILFSAFTNVFAGEVTRTEEAFFTYPNIHVKMEVDVKRDRDIDRYVSYSSSRKNLKESVYLRIYLRNFTKEKLDDLTISYSIDGIKTSRGSKKTEEVLNDVIKLKPFKPGEERTVKTKKAEFENYKYDSRNYHSRSGMKFRKYKVTVYYKGEPILVGTP
ncbi:MAG: hypothetical protein P9M03_09595 [Candidatus Theseobacter exili]|nr:hypothetical protein [Candidatus Theseobacter exili]